MFASQQLLLCFQGISMRHRKHSSISGCTLSVQVNLGGRENINIRVCKYVHWVLEKPLVHPTD